MNAFTPSFRTALFSAVGLLIALQARAADNVYDPLTRADSAEIQTLDLTVHDGSRQRDIPIRVYLPPGKAPAPVVLFSHGLGGSREGYAYLDRHWAARGYAGVFLQHSGSDTSVWQDVPPNRRFAAMQKAASLQNLLLRVKDVPAVLDQLGLWDRSTSHSLAGRLDLDRVGMAGHSFGAVTTEAVSGQVFPMATISFTDSRIKAALVLSPSAPRRGDPAQAFGSVHIPWMLMTGTRDLSPVGGIDMESRLAVFPALPAGNKYELVLDNAEHSAFTDRALPGDREARNPNHHRAILALSTAFWDTFLRDNPAARAWLNATGPASVLEPKDRWQKK